MEKEDGKYPSWHGSVYPTAKGRTEAETDLCANSVNPEAGTFYSNFPHEWLRQIMYSLFLFLPSLTSRVRQNGLKFWSASQARRKVELILWNNTRIPAFKAPFSGLIWKLRSRTMQKRSHKLTHVKYMNTSGLSGFCQNLSWSLKEAVSEKMFQKTIEGSQFSATV